MTHNVFIHQFECFSEKITLIVYMSDFIIMIQSWQVCTVRTLGHGKLDRYSISAVVTSWLNVHYQPVSDSLLAGLASGDNSDMIQSVVCFIGYLNMRCNNDSHTYVHCILFLDWKWMSYEILTIQTPLKMLNDQLYMIFCHVAAIE